MKRSLAHSTCSKQLSPSVSAKCYEHSKETAIAWMNIPPNWDRPGHESGSWKSILPQAKIGAILRGLNGLSLSESFPEKLRPVAFPAKAQGHFCGERLFQLVAGYGTMRLHAQSYPWDGMSGADIPTGQGFLIYWVYFSMLMGVDRWLSCVWYYGKLIDNMF